jgi:predicted DNA-binding transcriptional regulator AlpA
MTALAKVAILNLPDKPTMRPDEVATIFSCSKKHVYHLVEDGSLTQAVDIKCKFCSKPAIRIVTESVREFVEKRRI